MDETALPPITETPAYASEAYAKSLREFGQPRHLPTSGGWLLDRQIPGNTDRDAMGCYPLFSCLDWASLGDDLAAIGNNLISLVAVTDPLGCYDEAMLNNAFPDLVIPFKRHYIADLTLPLTTLVNAEHRRKARRALEKLTIECPADVPSQIAEWTQLYGNLKTRHEILGIAAFSPASFSMQASVPGAVLLKASIGSTTVGMTWWYVNGDTAYYHLGAYSDLGYSISCSYGLFMRTFEKFSARGVRWAMLGGTPGLLDANSGLAVFKRGWSSETRPSYLCGRIFDRGRYDALTKASGDEGTKYFPAYRRGESF